MSEALDKLKKTEYSFMVSWGMNCFNGIWRGVYTDGNGHYFVKYNSELKDVTREKEHFIKD